MKFGAMVAARSQRSLTINAVQRPREAHSRTTRACLLALLLLGFSACSSPNRGWWRGSFEGDVTGTMEFSINSRGTRAKGKITGNLSTGESFRAEFEGTLNQGYLRTELVGSSDTEFGLRAGFEGSLSGDLDRGEADGNWRVQLRQVGRQLEGQWQASHDLNR